jgi:beta-glucosidase
MGRTKDGRRPDRARWAGEHVIIHQPFTWSFRRTTLLLAITLGLGGAMVTPLSAATRPASRRTSAAEMSIGTRSTAPAAACPWILPSVQKRENDSQLAEMVLARMTLLEKADFVVLHNDDGYENVNSGVPTLCIPVLTMQDGPNGLSAGATGVTALPSSLGVAASFNLSLAYRYGQVLGQEARGKGIDAVQGPNLNLLRVPESGRAFEGYGEDPVLVGAMGVAEIDGIQSEGVMADAKHFTAYNQETARNVLDQRISLRVLEELYLAPFKAAVEQARVASIMCAYGAINGVNDCSNPTLYAALRSWNFPGFVRSDLEAVKNQEAAFKAGLDLIKPDTPAAIVDLVNEGHLSTALLNEAVGRVLIEMFRFHLIGAAPRGAIEDKVATKQHAQFALVAAEHSIVLLKNSKSILPLAPLHNASVAVIGTDASSAAASEGGGSANVIGPFLVKPLAAIEQSIGKRHVTYAPGEPETPHLPLIPAQDFRSGSPLPVSAPRVHHHLEPGKSDLGIIHAKGVTKEIATAEYPEATGSAWTTWKATIVPPKSGLYELSLGESGDTWLSINGNDVMAFRGLHGRVTWTTTVSLVGGRRYYFQLDWFRTSSANPRLGWEYVSPLIEQAAMVARRAHTAVVFVSDFNTEGFDRPDLSLPGDDDALIAAVAAANPRTVVVLNTGGAVLMPWLKSVEAVIEAWYPGEEDGAATAAVLFGAVDPAGRLPITFPPSSTEVATALPSRWPGIGGAVEYSEGLDIGYRYDEVEHLQPLFAFGYGLSYTSFRVSAPKLRSFANGDVVTVRVSNTGKRPGTDVVQCYLEFPAAAGEPPRQLRAFEDANLGPGRSTSVHLDLTQSAFQIYENGRFEVPGGSFTAFIGSSSDSFTGQIQVRPPAQLG